MLPLPVSLLLPHPVLVAPFPPLLISVLTDRLKGCHSMDKEVIFQAQILVINMLGINAATQILYSWVHQRDGVPQMRPDFPDSSHLMKMLRNVGQEQPLRPILQPATIAKPDSNPSNSKWERAIPVNVGPVLQYPSRTSQPVPYTYQQTLSKIPPWAHLSFPNQLLMKDQELESKGLES